MCRDDSLEGIARRLRLWIAAGALLAAGSLAGLAHAQVTALQPVRLWVHSDPGEVTGGSARLPYRWDRAHEGGGTTSFEFQLPAAEPGQRRALYFPRIGNAFRVWLDGRLIADETAQQPDRVNTVHRPRLLALPDSSDSPSKLLIQIWTLAGADGGLSAVLLGPLGEMLQAYESANRWTVVGALAVAMVSLVLGALACLVWMQQHEPAYLYFALAEVFWSGRTVGHYLTDHLPMPWPLWGFLMTTLYCAALASMCLFGLALVNRGRGAHARAVLGFLALSVGLLLICFAFEHHAWWRQWRIGILLFCLYCAAVVARQAVLQRSREAVVLAGVCGIALVAGVRDWLVITVASDNYTAQPAMTYAWMAFGVSMAWLLGTRLKRATQAQAQHAQDLRDRLAAQERSLAEAFDLQRRASEQQAASEERRRVLQDMHDGVGHELLGALQISRQDAVPRETVTDQIQRALDHLKLTVDVLQDGAQDVSTILGLLRYRLTPRLQAAGITMEWRVPTLPALEAWDTRRARDLQLLLYEAFSNLVAHSGATHALFAAEFDADGSRLTLLLADNGRGLAPDLRHGNGLQSIQARAQRLRSTLRMGSGDVAGLAGASLRLSLPVQLAVARAPETVSAP